LILVVRHPPASFHEYNTEFRASSSAGLIKDRILLENQAMIMLEALKAHNIFQGHPGVNLTAEQLRAFPRSKIGEQCSELKDRPAGM
jgi:hypothetical protein